ncbi:MAG: SHOCT domain-containing protein [Candidatus Bathyarchaeota archaeon]|nr:SHOCT domain-containing protein [Candidatus Bathyarchaeota archaeon]
MFGYWGMGGMMWLWAILFFGCGGWLWWGYRPRYYRGRRYMSMENPVEIARRRLARGKITLEEFERIKKAVETRD